MKSVQNRGIKAGQMNRKAFLKGASVILVLALGILLFRECREKQRMPMGANPRTGAGSAEANQKHPDSSSRGVTLESATDPEAIGIIEDEIGRMTQEERGLKPKDASWLDWSHIISMHRIMKSKNGNVTFFGKVVSEDGRPVNGVSLVAEVSYFEPSLAKAITDSTKGQQKVFPLETDENGEFEISGIEGFKLVLRDFQKTGFELAGKKKGWGYSFMPDNSERHVADSSNREVFKMKRAE